MSNNLYKHSYKHLRRSRTVFCVLVTLVLCIFTVYPAQAFSDLYTVEGIEVDVTAKNALEAREEAFNEAQVKAYQELVERLASNGAENQNKDLDAESISFMVQDFEVTKEQLSAKRYKGIYTIRFRPDAFQSQIINQGGSYSDIPRGDVLILPFYQAGANTVLWGQMNPFLSAWARQYSSSIDLTSIVVPIGDIEDVAQVNESSPLSYDPVKLERMRERYGANEVSLILASPEIGANGVENLRVSLYSAKIRGPEFAGQMKIDGVAGETINQLFDRAVLKLTQQYKSDWKEQTAVSSTEIQNISAVMNFHSVREWINTKQLLESVPGMDSVRVNRLTPREANVSLNYHGDIKNLGLVIGRLGLAIVQSGNAYQPTYRIIRGNAPSYNNSNAPVYSSPNNSNIYYQ